MDHIDGIDVTGASFAGWIPIRLFIRDDALWVDWCFRGAHTFKQPFFRQDVETLLRKPFNVVYRRHTPIDALVAWAERGGDGVAIAPLRALVGHVSRCGSTLICQMLATQSSHVVVSEPPMLDMLLGVNQRLSHVSLNEKIRWLRALVFALCQAPNGERHTVMKLDAWHVFEYDLFRAAFPDVPMLFVFRDPVEVAVSHIQETATYMIPGAVGTITRCVPFDEAVWTSPERYIAAVLGEIYAAGAEACEGGGVMALSYRSLPSIVWTQLREVLGLGDDEATIRSLLACTERDAKRPSDTFSDDSHRKRDEASPVLREAVVASCARAYESLQKCAVATTPLASASCPDTSLR